MPPLGSQFRISDILLLTALIAGIVAGVPLQLPIIPFITASCLGIFIWHRPIVSRLWLIAMLSLGAGLIAAGAQRQYLFAMNDGEVIAWGVGMVAGSIAYLAVFTWIVQIDRKVL